MKLLKILESRAVRVALAPVVAGAVCAIWGLVTVVVWGWNCFMNHPAVTAPLFPVGAFQLGLMTYMAHEFFKNAASPKSLLLGAPIGAAGMAVLFGATWAVAVLMGVSLVQFLKATPNFVLLLPLAVIGGACVVETFMTWLGKVRSALKGIEA